MSINAAATSAPARAELTDRQLRQAVTQLHSAVRRGHHPGEFLPMSEPARRAFAASVEALADANPVALAAHTVGVRAALDTHGTPGEARHLVRMIAGCFTTTTDEQATARIVADVIASRTIEAHHIRAAIYEAASPVEQPLEVYRAVARAIQANPRASQQSIAMQVADATGRAVSEKFVRQVSRFLGAPEYATERERAWVWDALVHRVSAAESYRRWKAHGPWPLTQTAFYERYATVRAELIATEGPDFGPELDD